MAFIRVCALGALTACLGCGGGNAAPAGNGAPRPEAVPDFKAPPPSDGKPDGAPNQKE